MIDLYEVWERSRAEWARDGEEWGRWYNGEHRTAHVPRDAEVEYRQLVQQAPLNYIQLAVNALTEPLHVEGATTPEAWSALSGTEAMDQQGALYLAAAMHGTAYVEVTKAGEAVPIPRSQAVVLTARGGAAGQAEVAMVRHSSDCVRVADNTHEWFMCSEDGKVLSEPVPHGFSRCPFVLFRPVCDLDGWAPGLVSPLIRAQQQVNQAALDLMIGQVYTSHVVRTATGLTPPLKRKWVPDPLDPDGEGSLELELDENGQPVPLPHRLGASRFLFAESPEAKFGHIPGGDLSGLLQALQDAVTRLMTLAQAPPHYVLGQQANMSAEALQSVEGAMLRRIRSIQRRYGRSWAEVGGLLGQAAGEPPAETEVVWGEVALRSEAQAADAALKWRQAGVPAEAVWAMHPHATPEIVKSWKALADQDGLEWAFGEAGDAQ